METKRKISHNILGGLAEFNLILSKVNITKLS